MASETIDNLMNTKIDIISWIWMLANLVMIATLLYLIFQAVRKFSDSRRRES